MRRTATSLALTLLAACSGPTPRAEPDDAGQPETDAGRFETSDAGLSNDGGARADAGAQPGRDGGPTLAWFSDWRTATGSSQTARYDGSRWTAQLCASPVLEVVPGRPLGFPTTNALRASYRRPGECQMVQATGRWSAPAVGEYLFVRFYVRNDLPEGAAVGNPHPLHLGRAGSVGPPYALWFNFGAPTAGRARMVLQLGGGPEYPDRFWSYPFSTGQVYRVEVRVHRRSATTASVDLRVSDASGALIGQSADWDNGEIGANRRTLAQSAPTFPVTDDSFTLLEVGNNDPGGLLEEPGNRHVSFAGVAVVIDRSSEAWPGAWPVGPEAVP